VPDGKAAQDCPHQGVGLVDEVAEGAPQVQGFGGEGAGGLDGAGVLGAQRLKANGGLVSIVSTDTCLENIISSVPAGQ
jgi:hypothetical protein